MNYRWFSQSLVIRAFGIHLHVHQQPRDHREKEKKNKIKVTHKNKEKKIIPLLINAMAEKKEVHRCHAQYNPLSLFKIKKNKNLTKKKTLEETLILALGSSLDHFCVASAGIFIGVGRCRVLIQLSQKDLISRLVALIHRSSNQICPATYYPVDRRN